MDARLVISYNTLWTNVQYLLTISYYHSIFHIYSKVIKNPPAFIKPTTASKFRKAHHTESAWKEQDIIQEFNAKYGIGVPIEKIVKPTATAGEIQEHTRSLAKTDPKGALIELLVR